MATTRIMPLHIGKGRTESRAISDIIDYVANPQKTDNGKLITGYGCDSRTLAATSAVLQSQRDFVIMRCQSPHEAALGERALPDRPAICYNSFREVSDSLQWTVHSQYRWCHLAGEPPWCCPKSFGISGHILS